MRKKPPHRATYLEDSLHALADMERTFAELESSDVFQAFTSTEKARYRDALSRLRDLIHDLELDTAQEQLASSEPEAALFKTRSTPHAAVGQRVESRSYKSA